MNHFEKVILYILSFILFPIGFITWIISLFNQSQQMKKVGRTALYFSLVSFCLQILIGAANYILYTNVTVQ
ncbi:hypothetical protein BRE01_60650 [Brevibacillus reuszeri]|uniref:Group-specific protein n=1 Tax=Brevibacillus reuszeri TaxID=54915 RepID=A0A0K9YZB0_9BACL|nr:hypothetical protein [Brevibacillus reuszeri]KNB73991.1 hypothetical protein ADS79_08740 [Brevibacillus reuszeri]MED1859842.1 hypothetical protein [Brevibacillus reuszeri]GED72363.1 hypothetical protein BRE01_60650 [Brevibacillus reuszeri]